MIFRPLVKYHRGLVGAALLSALALSVVTGMASSERMVASGFADALTEMASQDMASSQTVSGSVSLAQSEDFWLRHGQSAPSTQIQPVVWNGQLVPGDRVSISGHDGDVRELQVVEARPVDEATRLDVATSNSSLTLVLCRDTAHPQAPLVRFLVSNGATLPFNQIKVQRAS